MAVGKNAGNEKCVICGRSLKDLPRRKVTCRDEPCGKILKARQLRRNRERWAGQQTKAVAIAKGLIRE